jgi:hypothetical protein
MWEVKLRSLPITGRELPKIARARKPMSNRKVLSMIDRLAQPQPVDAGNTATGPTHHCWTLAAGHRPRRIGGKYRPHRHGVEVARKATAMQHQGDPDKDREERVFEKSLREHGQLAEADVEELPPGATHKIEKDDEGHDVARRKRFSAF